MAAQLHEVFVTLTQDLRTVSEDNGRASRCLKQRKWMRPEAMDTSILAVATLHIPHFVREEINAEYAELHKDAESGKVGEAGSLKIQLDYVAVAERAFRMRHATHARCVAHSAARFKGHGNDAGVFGHVRNYAQDLIDAAGA